MFTEPAIRTVETFLKSLTTARTCRRRGLIRTTGRAKIPIDDYATVWNRSAVGSADSKGYEDRVADFWLPAEQSVLRFV